MAKARKIEAVSVVSHKSLYFDCHSGLDPESSLFALDSRFCGNDDFGINVKKRWGHYTRRKPNVVSIGTSKKM